MHVRLHHQEQIAPNIISFHFEPERPVRYTAGQFVEIHLYHENKDKRGDKRWFTLSSAPEDPYLTITTNFAAEHGSSFKSALRNLADGSTVIMSAPMGDFVLPKNPDIPLLFVAGGIGCTPFHSIIASLQSTGEERDITLLYAARSPEAIAFKETFGVLGKKFQPAVDNAPNGWSGINGRLDAATVLEYGQPSPEHYVYISGPEPMTESLYKELKKSGVNKRHLFTDYFPGYTAV